MGVNASEPSDWFLYELDALGAQLVISSATILHGKHKGRHGPLRYHFTHGKRCCGIEHRLLRQEQAKLERGLVRMLHREPAVVPVGHVGMHLEAQFTHVKLERLVLVVHVKTDYCDSFAHFRTSVFSVSVLSPSSRRRFSETAI